MLACVLCQAANLLEPLHVSSIRVVGIANSKRMLVDPAGLDLATWKDDLAGDKVRPQPVDHMVTIMNGCDSRHWQSILEGMVGPPAWRCI